MVGQAQGVRELLHITPELDSPKLGLRKIAVLTLGLVNQPLTLEEFHTFTKNLASRLGSRVGYSIPPQDNFANLVRKLCRHEIVTHQYSLSRNIYGYSLSLMGEGEYDGILYSLESENISHILKEFRRLIEIAF